MPFVWCSAVETFNSGPQRGIIRTGLDLFSGFHVLGYTVTEQSLPVGTPLTCVGELARAPRSAQSVNKCITASMARCPAPGQHAVTSAHSSAKFDAGSLVATLQPAALLLLSAALCCSSGCTLNAHSSWVRHLMDSFSGALGAHCTPSLRGNLCKTPAKHHQLNCIPTCGGSVALGKGAATECGSPGEFDSLNTGAAWRSARGRPRWVAMACWC